MFREGRTFEKAYLIDLLQHMLERGEIIHRIDTDGGYMEIDTLEDAALVRGVVARLRSRLTARRHPPTRAKRAAGAAPAAPARC